jgi:uncharacterized integral membrane protein
VQRILKWVIGIPVAFFVIVFAISNRQRVALRFDPLTTGETANAIEMPLWLLFFVGIALGIIVGWIGSWFAQGKYRKRAREASAEIARLQAERAELIKRVEAENATTPERNVVPVGTSFGSGWI